MSTLIPIFKEPKSIISPYAVDKLRHKLNNKNSLLSPLIHFSGLNAHSVKNLKTGCAHEPKVCVKFYTFPVHNGNVPFLNIPESILDANRFKGIVLLQFHGK